MLQDKCFLLPFWPSLKGRSRHVAQFDTWVNMHVPEAKFFTRRRLDRIASPLTDAHARSKSKLQVEKGMSLFTFSKAALGIKLQMILEELLWASCGENVHNYQTVIVRVHL